MTANIRVNRRNLQGHRGGGRGGEGGGDFEVTEFTVLVLVFLLSSISVGARVHVGVSVSGTLLMALLCIAMLLPLLTIQV